MRRNIASAVIKCVLACMALAPLPPIDDPHMGADAAGIALLAFSVILDVPCEELLRYVAVTFDDRALKYCRRACNSQSTPTCQEDSIFVYFSYGRRVRHPLLEK
jgi:hypothetical protein